MTDKPDYRSIGKWISVLYRKFQIEINKVLKPYQLNSFQYIFLIQLYKGDGVSQDCLSKELYIDKSATARALQQLENNGYVTRSVNPLDKRSNCVYLTEKAVSIKEELRDLLHNWNDKMTRSLTDDEYTVVYDALKQMSEDILSEGADHDGN